MVFNKGQAIKYDRQRNNPDEGINDNPPCSFQPVQGEADIPGIQFDDRIADGSKQETDQEYRPLVLENPVAG